MRLRLEEPKLRFPSKTNWTIAIKIEPINEVTAHKVSGAGKLTMVAACIVHK